MAKGIKLPTRVVKGRIALLGGDDYIAQLVLTALGDGESENPFQDLGLGERMIFDINDDITQAEIKQRVEIALAPLERDRLARFERLRFESDGAQKKMFLQYKNLETDERDEVEVPIPTE